MGAIVINNIHPRTFACPAGFSSIALKVAAVLMILTSSLALGAVQRATFGPCRISAAEAVGLGGDLSTDVRAADNYAAMIARMLKAGEFSKLDCLADHARVHKERFPGGMWKLKQLYSGIDEPVPAPVHPTQPDWNALFHNLHLWVSARPRSTTARVALGWAYINYARDARGTGTIDTVSQSGWKLFGGRIAKARQILEEASTLPQKCPEWYVAMLIVAGDEDWEADKKLALFEEAFKFEPGYYYYARVRANRLLPKWGGRPGDTEKFTEAMADRIGGDQGDILYFQVASANYIICGCEDDPHLSWERIQRGFSASEKQYGVSMLNLNRLAFLASKYGTTDPAVAEKILERIGDQWDAGTWETKEDFEYANKQAANNAPILAKLKAIETAADANTQTPEGLRLQASFEKQLRELTRQCEVGNSDVGKFKTLIDVGEKGTVDDIRVYWHSAASHCVYEKLVALKHDNTISFPPPPHTPFWVRFDLDWGDAAPIAAK
jgi:hypothetical protein